MKLLILAGAAIAFLSAFRPVRADDCAADPATHAIDVEFDAAIEAWAVRSSLATSHQPLATLVNALDSDRYAERAKAGAQLAAIVSADRSAVRFLLRARAVERRPEVRYWLNRTLRVAYRCAACDGLGYCATFTPTAPEPALYSGVPCRRCGRTEWQHGPQWNEGAYTHLACDQCHGAGTHWNHYAVD